MANHVNMPSKMMGNRQRIGLDMRKSIWAKLQELDQRCIESDEYEAHVT